MAEINIFPETSPRLVEVLPPTTTITVQALTDLIKQWEHDSLNLSFDKLVNTSGKESLGGGVSVGITAELQNAQILFSAQSVSDSSGTATTANAAGTRLIDSAATFVTDGINPGDSIFNTTDGSVATVISVDSEIQITHLALADGTDNDWDTSDAYKIWNKVLCEVNGGNLVAVDINGDPITPLVPSAFTYATRTTSSSGTISTLEITNIQYQIEALREGHSATGTILFWDPINGNDASDGLSPGKAVKTFAKAHDLVVDNNNDTINCLASSALTTVDEVIYITKNNVLVRGPGRHFVIKPTSTASDTVTISGDGVALSGIQLETATSGTRDALVINGGNNLLIRNCWVKNAQGNGIVVTDGDFLEFFNVFVDGSGSNALKVNNDVLELVMINCWLVNSGTHGASLTSASIAQTLFQNCKIHLNAGNGINIAAGVTGTRIRRDNLFDTNTGADIVDAGTNTVIEQEVVRAADVDAMWDEATSGHATSGTFGKNATDIRTSQQKEYSVHLSADYKVVVGNTYRAKLFVLNFEAELTNAATTPTITIYRQTRTQFKTDQDMTLLSTGIYEYTVTIGSSQSTGIWESEVTVDVGGIAPIKTSCYFEVLPSAA